MLHLFFKTCVIIKLVIRAKNYEWLKSTKSCIKLEISNCIIAMNVSVYWLALLSIDFICLLDVDMQTKYLVKYPQLFAFFRLIVNCHSRTLSKNSV